MAPKCPIFVAGDAFKIFIRPYELFLVINTSVKISQSKLGTLLPHIIVIFVDYPELSVLLIFGLVTFYFLNIKIDLLETLYAFHCNHYFHKYNIFPTVELIQNTPPTLILPHPLSFPH